MEWSASDWHTGKELYDKSAFEKYIHFLLLPKKLTTNLSLKATPIYFFTSFCRLRIQACLTWVLCSGSHQAAVRASERRVLIWSPVSFSKLMLIVSRILFLCRKTEASVFFLPAYWVSLSAPSEHPQVLGVVLSQHGSLLLQSEENAFPVDKMRSYNVKSSQKGQPHHIHRSCPCPRGQESWGHLRTRLTPRRD